MGLRHNLGRLLLRGAADDLPPQGSAPIQPGSTGAYSLVGSGGGGLMSYPAALRVTELVSVTTARVIIETLHEIDEVGNRIETEGALEMLAVMRDSWDGGRTSALVSCTDTVADLCRSGNAYLLPTKTGAGRLVRIRRFEPSLVEWDRTRGRYWVREALREDSPRISVSASDLIHLRWGPTIPNRDGGFSESPLKRIKDAIAIGQHADDWVDGEMQRPPGGGVIVSVEKPAPPGNTKDDEGRKREITQYRNFTRRLLPWMFEGRGAVSVAEVRRRANDAAVPDTRRHQMAVVCSVFGVPPSKMAVGPPMSSAEEEAAFWKDGIAPMVSKVLEPLSSRLLRRRRRFAVDPIHLLRDASNLPAVVDALRPNTGVTPIVPVSYIRRRVGISLTGAEQAEYEEQMREAEAKPAPPAAPAPPPRPGDDEAAAEPEADEEAVAAALSRLQCAGRTQDAIAAMAEASVERA